MIGWVNILLQNRIISFVLEHRKNVKFKRALEILSWHWAVGPTGLPPYHFLNNQNARQQFSATALQSKWVYFHQYSPQLSQLGIALGLLLYILQVGYTNIVIFGMEFTTQTRKDPSGDGMGQSVLLLSKISDNKKQH